MKPKKTSLKDYLIDKIPLNLITQVNRSFEIVGNIAIIEISEQLEKFEEEIGEALLKVNKNIKTVLKKQGIHKGEFRTQDLIYLAGENTKETIYLENGISLKLNPEKVYFSARLSTERESLMNNLNKNKKVLIMFSGCGPYTFVALKKQPDLTSITSIELNPYGTKYSIESLALNKNLLKKSKIYKNLLDFLRENNLPVKEKELIENLNSLKIRFVNGDVKEEVKKFKLEKTTSLKEDSHLIDKNIKKSFENLILFKKEELSFNLDELEIFQKEQLKYFLIYFSKKFKFKICIDFCWYLFENDFEKGFLLEILEEKSKVTDINKFDEIFMPLPKDASSFLSSAFSVSKKNTIIHMYDFVKQENFPKETKEKILTEADEKNISIEILQIRKVGQYSPKKYRVCCDFKITKI